MLLVVVIIARVIFLMGVKVIIALKEKMALNEIGCANKDGDVKYQRRRRLRWYPVSPSPFLLLKSSARRTTQRYSSTQSTYVL